MFASSILLALVLPAYAKITNLVLTNDDGWAVAQIRAQFDALTAAGYNVWCFPLFAFFLLVMFTFLSRRLYCLRPHRTNLVPAHPLQPPPSLPSRASSTPVRPAHPPRDSMPPAVSFCRAIIARPLSSPDCSSSELGQRLPVSSAYRIRCFVPAI
jgi:hypothetical protein